MLRKPSVLTIALSGGVIALIVSVISSIITLNAEERFRNQAVLSNNIILTLEGIQLGAVTAETSQRGFLIHGNKDYLSSYHEGIRDLRDGIDNYESLLRGRATSSQVKKTARLRDLADAKLTELDEVISLYNSGNKEGAFDVFRSGRGVRAMNGIRQIIDDLEQEEEMILGAARESAATARRRTAIAVVLLALLSLFGFALAYLNHFRSDRLTVVEEHAADLAEARERTDLLARELNHRVKNLFAIVQSIISATGRQESDPKVAAAKMRERVHALSLAHSLTSTLDAQQETSLHDLLEAIVRPQRMDDQTLDHNGPHVTVPAQFVTPIGMILHELTTNAIKYGAWSAGSGNISVDWTVQSSDDSQTLELHWTEQCDSSQIISAPEKEGFGSRMMAMSLIQLGGTQQREWASNGIRLRVVLPLDGKQAISGRN